MTTNLSLGFIGVGSITASVVTGLHAKITVPDIYLSPRSDDISKSLVAKFPNVHRETSNAEVVSKSQIVVLAMRPEQLGAALTGLTFRPDQTVVSFVATVPIDEITKMVSPASKVCRVTPLTTISNGQGPIVISPAMASVEAIFDGIGNVIVAQTEEQMMAFGCAAALLSTFLELEHTVSQWLIAKGIAPADASLYVRSMFSGVANSALNNRELALTDMAESNETPGGLNERVRVALRDYGIYSQVEKVLSELSSLSLVPPEERQMQIESQSGYK